MRSLVNLPDCFSSYLLDSKSLVNHRVDWNQSLCDVFLCGFLSAEKNSTPERKVTD